MMRGLLLVPILFFLATGCGGESAADAGPDAPPDAPIDAVPPPDAHLLDGPLMPRTLAETGLYSDFENEVIAGGVKPYEPQYKLWSDGATKRRWIYLPPGGQIDTSDPDFWVYPPGTKLWKEFTVDGVRVETRLIYKTGTSPESWYMMAYAWNEAQTEATAEQFGKSNALGTNHDIPSQVECQKCHSPMPDRVLGFSALMLDHSGDGVTLDSLIADGRLTVLPPGAESPHYPIPGDATAQAALGYLHANCSGCHNEESSVFAEKTQMRLRLSLVPGALASVEATPTYQTTVGVMPEFDWQDLNAIIEAGNPDGSVLYSRMGYRGGNGQMPPICSDEADTAGRAKIAAWITSL